MYGITVAVLCCYYLLLFLAEFFIVAQHHFDEIFQVDCDEVILVVVALFFAERFDQSL